jgi:glycosyltransferase involved in cell wall biosynthesis
VKVVSVLTSASDGGAEFAAVAMLDALAARGHDVVLLSNQAGIGRDTRVAVRPVALGSKLSRRTYPTLAAAAPVLLARLRRALEREAPYDALLVHFKKEQLLAPALPRGLRPVLAWAEWGPVPSPLRRGPANRAYRWAARDVDAVLAVSSGTQASVVAAGVDPRRVHVVHNVVSAEDVRPDPAGGDRLRAELGIAQEAFVIGCVSRWHPKKRNDVVVDAALRLAADRDGRPVALVMAGDGDMEAALRARAAPLGPAAHFLPTPGPRLTGVLSACDAVVFCPSPTEGAPRAVILTMLCERPCVAGGREGVTDLLAPGTGAIAEPEHDPAAVAALLRRYRDDPALGRREGAAARRRAAEMHDAERIGAQVERLLRLDGGAGTPPR